MSTPAARALMRAFLAGAAMTPAPRALRQTQCRLCRGSGHVCLRCSAAIPACPCDARHGLDTEEIAACPDCQGTGIQLREVPYAKA